MKRTQPASRTSRAKMALARRIVKSASKIGAESNGPVHRVVHRVGSRVESPMANPAQSPVEQYLAAVPEPAATTLQKLRTTIRSCVPADATEAISYGMPSFRCQGMGIVVWYAAFTQHCSLFPTAEMLEQFRSELTNYKTSKGTIQFSLAKPLPVTLVKKIVKARMAILERKKKR